MEPIYEVIIMPTYHYRCTHCKKEHSDFQRITDKPLKKCKHCKKNTLVRMLYPSNIHFKGDGWTN